MKAIMKIDKQQGFEIKEVEQPEINADEVLVKLIYSSVCGTDLHIWKWDEWARNRIKPPLIVGHELCGEIVELGESVSGVEIGEEGSKDKARGRRNEVKAGEKGSKDTPSEEGNHVKKGDIISAETHLFDGTCEQCRNGNKHICENVKILGVDVDGVWGEYCKLPARNAWNSNSLDKEIVSLQEPFGNAVHTVFSGGDIQEKSVLVIGCGMTGLCAVAIAKASGAERVIGIDVEEYRVKMAERMGADGTVKGDGNVVEEALRLSNNHGFDVVLEMSGNPDGLRNGFELLKNGGRAAILGVFPKPVEFDFTNKIVFKGARVFGVNGRKIWETWEKGKEILESGKVDLKKLVTHKKKFDEIEECMQLMEEKQCGKILIEP